MTLNGLLNLTFFLFGEYMSVFFLFQFLLTSHRKKNTLSAGLVVTNTDSLAAFQPPTFEGPLASKLLFTVIKKDGDGRRVCSKLKKFNRQQTTSRLYHPLIQTTTSVDTDL